MFDIKTKFNVDRDTEKRTFEGVVYDSKLEMRFFRDWILPKMESGEIKECDRQVKFELQEKFIHDGKSVKSIDYIADFVVTYSNGHVTVFDTKGMPDTTAIIKRKLFWHKYPDIDYQWISYSKQDGGWISYDELKKKRNERKKAKKLKEIQ